MASRGHRPHPPLVIPVAIVCPPGDPSTGGPPVGHARPPLQGMNMAPARPHTYVPRAPGTSSPTVLPMTVAHRPNVCPPCGSRVNTAPGVPSDHRPTRSPGDTIACLHGPTGQLHPVIGCYPAPRTIEFYPHDLRTCVCCRLHPRVDSNIPLGMKVRTIVASCCLSSRCHS